MFLVRQTDSFSQVWAPLQKNTASKNVFLMFLTLSLLCMNVHYTHKNEKPSGIEYGTYEERKEGQRLDRV